MKKEWENIVLFTSNYTGGIPQFVIQMIYELLEMGKEVKAFIPASDQLLINDDIFPYVERYKKPKTLNVHNGGIKRLKKYIIDFKPDLVWFFDNSILSSELSILIGKTATQMMIFHDAGGAHPTNNESLINRARVYIEEHYSNFAAKKFIDYVLLLSEESRKKYISLFPYNASKTRKLNLGAHIIIKPEKKPPEIDAVNSKFILFFGRIDKYKGLDRAIKAINAFHSNEIILVVAGKGDVSFLGDLLINKDNIILINRYIDDGEMIYLFRNSSGVILPYIEATQSGILPIAYYYGKPVICSDIPGLSQFVIHGQTGFVAKHDEEYKKYINILLNENNSKISKNCKEYYNNNLSWKSNLVRMFDSL